MRKFISNCQCFICREIYKKIRCTQNRFKQICQGILMDIAKRTYQLDIVSQQVLLPIILD
jgi:hypothetical protein